MATPSARERVTELNPLESGSDVGAFVAALSAEASDRDEFLHKLASHFQVWFAAGVVAVHDDQWDHSRMLVNDSSLAAGIDRDRLRDLLVRAGKSVLSAQVPVRDVSGLVMAGQPEMVATGLTIELLPSPQRVAAVIILRDPPPPAELMAKMKLLGSCGRAIQTTRSGVDVPSKEMQSPSREIQSVDRSRSVNELDRLASVRQSLRSFHQTLDPTATAYRIASELPRLLPCERAVVLLPTSMGRRRKYVVNAISGSSVVDRRSPLIQTMNALADKVAVMNQAMILPRQLQDDASDITVSDLPPQIMEPLESYLDESGVLSCVVIPVHTEDEDQRHDESGSDTNLDRSPRQLPIAILFLETFSGQPSQSITPAMREITLEAATAITNATRYDNVFALPLRRPLAGLSRRVIRNWVAVISLVLIGLAAASWFIRVDHNVVATGIARPVERRAMFARVDGIVETIAVRDGERVSADDILLRLENAEVQREAQSLAGQLTTATAKLASLRAMQLASNDDPTQTAQNVIEQRTLANEIETLGQRIEINRMMQDELIVRAPIDGVVVGWRMDEKLQSRPVRRGDRLLAIIAPDGDWELDLKLEETKSGEVMRRYQLGEKLPISFAVLSRPTETMRATVQAVGGIARRQAEGKMVVDVMASIDADSISGFQSDNLRGDIDVTAKIVCGQRRLIDSWTDELVAWFHRNILFRF
ncbi:HlyD family efflux transporter periplasmic adaptor subunit [Neorhodopirellula pilleata]|nr:HlyD family efflux transporter periplasmic adaptor subunit [Neorhodopirellula pilleata]